MLPKDKKTTKWLTRLEGESREMVVRSLRCMVVAGEDRTGPVNGVFFFFKLRGQICRPEMGVGWLKTGALTGARYRALYTKGRMCWAKHTIQWAVTIRFDMMREVGPLPPFSSFLRPASPPTMSSAIKVFPNGTPACSEIISTLG